MNKQEKKIWAKPELSLDEIESTNGGSAPSTYEMDAFHSGANPD